MRFHLRTLLIVLLLLALSAPWWNDAWLGAKEWLWPPTDAEIAEEINRLFPDLPPLPEGESPTWTVRMARQP